MSVYFTSVANSSVVNDPTTQQPGFDLPSCHWSLINHFRLTTQIVHPAAKSGAQ